MPRPLCTTEGCTKITSTNGKCIAHGGGKRCTESGCEKSAIKNTGKCTAHGGGKRCSESGCDNGAKGTTMKCIAHGGGKRCNEDDCNNPVASKSNKCKDHGGGVTCSEKDCTNNAIGKIGKCRKHGGGKRCSEEGCTTSAADLSDKCKTHGGGQRCSETGCDNTTRNSTDKCSIHGGTIICSIKDCEKQVRYGYDKCMSHGGGKRCSEPECDKGADSKTGKCVSHGGGKRCPNCIDWIDSQCGSYRYDWYCARCFKRKFPDDPRSQVHYQHTKEMLVRDAINNSFKGFIHDKPLYTGACECTHRRRIDHRKLIGGTMVCVETDEFAHNAYDPKDEEIRYDDLFMVYSGKWIFIRFNPDKDKSNTSFEDKLTTLIEVLNEQIHRAEVDENKEPLEIIKLFY